ncbi:MAG: 3-phosphoshikimate 1-carboxyvinyltransferase [Chloroflexi bacterium]|nr:3-phosphoshikimate 1-carboxyvinyltransferase [Chloroflexota bacterium]
MTVAPADRLRGELRLPGDKSIAHRALLATALASGGATITIPSPGADVRSTAGAIATLGGLLDTETLDDGRVRYRVRGGGTPSAAMLPGGGDETLDCGNSGTSMRLFQGALAGRPFSATLIGDASLSTRPMERVAGPLRPMGVGIETTDGHAPIRLTGARPLRALTHELPVASAQVLGAVSLAALAADGETVVRVPGPTRDHTERLLGWLGAPIGRDGLTTRIVGPAGFRARDIDVPGDVSSAAFWLAAAALHPDAELRIRDVGLNLSRLGIIDVLRDMGADVTVLPGDATGPEPVGDLVVRGGAPLRAIRVDGARTADLIDELPMLAVVMAAADGISEVRDAAELRVKESDRITLVVAGLRAIGIEATELPDGWRIEGTGTHTATGAGGATTVHGLPRSRPVQPTIATHGDHRIAMAFAIAAVTGVAEGVVIDDPACAAVSYPTFWSDLARIGEASGSGIAAGALA